MQGVQPYFHFPLTPHQAHVFARLQDFILRDSARVFILKGHAGTGKTTLMAGLIRWLDDQNIEHQLLASTGRAAKILTEKTGGQATTIHSYLYVFEDLNEDLDKMSRLLEKGQHTPTQIRLEFALRTAPDEAEDTVYIVDEASMISDRPDAASFARFGTGNLLHDLLNFHKNSRLIFIGDECQLPPVNQEFSPALDAPYLQSTYHQQVMQQELTRVVRQENTNGIIEASERIRRQYKKNLPEKYGYLYLRGLNNISFYLTHISLIQDYILKIRTGNYQDYTLICQTNRHCHEINQVIRQALYGNNRQLTAGDLLMITQNNYPTGLMNGDQVIVKATGHREYRSNLTFIDVRVESLTTGSSHDVLLIEDVLHSGFTNISPLQQRNLLIDFNQRMKKQGLRQKDPAFKEAMMKDPYLNALRAVYGYAITCHKSQGGEWQEVYLYTDNKIQGIPRPGFYQWWYTAVTRARQQLHVVNDWYIK